MATSGWRVILSRKKIPVYATKRMSSVEQNMEYETIRLIKSGAGGGLSALVRRDSKKTKATK